MILSREVVGEGGRWVVEANEIPGGSLCSLMRRDAIAQRAIVVQQKAIVIDPDKQLHVMAD